MKMKIKIPLNGLDENQKKIQLEELMNNYENNYEFIESEDDNIYFGKMNTDENVFGILIKVNPNIPRVKAENFIYEKIKKYESVYPDCKFIFLPSFKQESQIVKITNTTKNVELI